MIRMKITRKMRVLMSLVMVQYITENGKMARDMDEENKYGEMVVYMRVIGKMIKQMVRVV